MIKEVEPGYFPKLSYARKPTDRVQSGDLVDRLNKGIGKSLAH